MKSYPSNVSRTLDPEGRSLLTVVGVHNNPLSDADVNLIQDIQDWKRAQITGKTAPSGCLTRQPYRFSGALANQFMIPAFDVLFRGEVVRVQGHGSFDPTMNYVTLPPPTQGLGAGKVFVVFLELWYAALDPETGDGYYVPDATHRYFYPWGCKTADPSLLTQFPDDAIDPAFDRETTNRVQLQWRIAVQQISLDYDFAKHRFGLDPDPLVSPRELGKALGQGANEALTSMAYEPLAGITGETALWRAGGDGLNSVATLDGYAYALPLAVVFQRSLNRFNPITTPFGCASSSGGGTRLSGLSGRYDGKFADVIEVGDVVDTRTTTSLTGYDADPLLRQGLADVMTGQLRTKVGRSDFPAEGVGSLLTRQVGVAPASVRATWRNILGVGSFDGYRNGISSDERTYIASLMFVPHPDGSGMPTAPWTMGDDVEFVLPEDCGGVVTSVFVQTLTAAYRTPVALQGSQIHVEGLGTRSIRVVIAKDITVSPDINPGTNPLVVTVGVTYPASSEMHLHQVPVGTVFGELTDPRYGVAGGVLPLFGVSDYDAFADLPRMLPATPRVTAYSPSHSTSTFGVRVHVRVPNASGTPGVPPNSVSFVIPRTALDGRLTGLYVTRAQTRSGADVPVLSRELVGDQVAVTVQGPLDVDSQTDLVILCHRTSQAAVNPAVQGVTALEETILFGSGAVSVDETTLDLAHALDSRILLAAPTELPGGGTQYTGLAWGGTLRGVSGDDSGDLAGLLWQMEGTSNRFYSTPCRLTVSAGAFILTVPNANLRNGSPWFVAASFLPALVPAAAAIFSATYVPYQGEAVAGRDYTMMLTGDSALVTTNGTGAAPVPGVQDVFPYDRQFPVVPTLPSRTSWDDSTLRNTPLRGAGDETNFSSKRQDNVETTYPAPLRANDFVPPLHGTLRRVIQFSQPTERGFAHVSPHVGFAIADPSPKNELGVSYATERAITLYVDNVAGSSANDGLSPETSLRTVGQALALLPPIIRHPVSVLLRANVGRPYSLVDLNPGDFMLSSVEGGVHCMGAVAFTMQDGGYVLFGPQDVTTNAPRVLFDGAGFNTALLSGAAPVAFLVSSGRVVFTRIAFTGFHFSTGTHLGAVRAYDADVEMWDCALDHPFLGITAVQGSRVTWTGGFVTLGSGEKGVLASESNVIVDSPTLQLEGVVEGAPLPVFFHGNYSSTVTLQNHDYQNDPSSEVAFPLPGLGAPPVVGRADLGSTLIAGPTWATQGAAVLNAQSTYQALREGGTQFRSVTLDSTSTQVGLLL